MDFVPSAPATSRPTPSVELPAYYAKPGAYAVTAKVYPNDKPNGPPAADVQGCITIAVSGTTVTEVLMVVDENDKDKFLRPQRDDDGPGTAENRVDWLVKWDPGCKDKTTLATFTIQLDPG